MKNTMPAETSNPRRHRFSYSLRTLFVVVTVGCLWLAWSEYVAREQSRLLERYIVFAEAIDAGRYPDAYAIMSVEFRQRNSLSDFKKDFPRGTAKELDPDSFATVSVLGTGSVFNGYVSDRLFVGTEYEWKQIRGQWYYTGHNRTFYD